MAGKNKAVNVRVVRKAEGAGLSSRLDRDRRIEELSDAKSSGTGGEVGGGFHPHAREGNEKRGRVLEWVQRKEVLGSGMSGLRFGSVSRHRHRDPMLNGTQCAKTNKQRSLL